MQFGCCVDVAHLSAVLSAGFDYAELQVASTLPEASSEAWEAAREQILGAKTPILGFNVLLPGNLPVVGPHVDVERRDRYVNHAFKRMSELGGKYVSFGSGAARRAPEDFPKETAEEQLKAFVSQLGKLGETYGIKVNIEFLNRKETNMIVSLAEANEYVKSVHLPSVGLLADLYHMMEESEPFEQLRNIAPHLRYVHVADTGRRNPGSGQYPFQAFASALREIGYDGPVSIECEWGPNVEEEMEASSRFLRAVF